MFDTWKWYFQIIIFGFVIWYFMWTIFETNNSKAEDFLVVIMWKYVLIDAIPLFLMIQMSKYLNKRWKVIFPDIYFCIEDMVLHSLISRNWQLKSERFSAIIMWKHVRMRYFIDFWWFKWVNTLTNNEKWYFG